MWSYWSAAVDATGKDEQASSVEDAISDLDRNVSDSEKQEIVSSDFLAKAKKFASGLPFVRDLAAGYFCLMDGDTPVAIKGSILIPLVYFVVPVDAIPDIIPAAGFTDDLAAWIGASKIFGSYINDEHYRSADMLLSSED